MWQSNRQQQQQQQQISYGLPNEIGMVGFRDMFFVTQSQPHPQSQHSNFHQEPPTLLNFDTQQHHHHSSGIGIGVLPILTSPSSIPLSNVCEQPKPNFVGGIGIGNTCSSSNTSTISCRDCGNQAKKGCSFKRCRTCCKSRGFDCSTHVKSTWIPAAKRRERHQVIGVAGGGGGGITSGSSSHSINSTTSKKPRVVFTSQNTTATPSHASTSNTTPPTSFESGSSHQADHRDDGKFYAAADGGGYKEALPGQVRAPAVFKCVRVTAIDDGDDEYAYQATVKIGGHVFKGFLYDQGVAEGRDGIPNMSDLHLGGGGGGGGSSSSPNVNYHSDVYALSGGQFLGGASTSYANPLN